MNFVQQIYDFNYKGKRYRPGLYSTIEEAVESLIIMQKEILENE